ncbi:hypothetical protein [Streptomyces sp. NPDC060205]|uniref:hypothetical protein n=1 Tax=Streptomyces sp. NPDC060205 TaxID=3347072 RepID=UPI0036688252
MSHAGGTPPVLPGGYIFCDAAGAVVIPAGSLPEVLETARAVDAEDARFVERIRADANPGTPQ